MYIESKMVCGVLALILFYGSCSLKRNGPSGNPPLSLAKKDTIIKLPEPFYKSSISIEEAILNRRSVRDYKADALTIKDISQLLWAAQGITSPGGKRTAPSAGGLYPLEIYLATWHVDSLDAGVYHFIPGTHSLEQVLSGDARNVLANAVNQGTAKEGAAALIITGVYSRTTWRFREKGKQYVYMEAGHAAQNVCLQAVSLNIGTVTMGSFNDSMVKQVLMLPAKNEPLYIMPLGRIK